MTELGRVDTLLNNAGYRQMASLERMLMITTQP